jgi:cellulose synthase/poly-beta-1,6-N-acetylglucosamine synthase-like glycosyltransferase
LSSDTIDVSYIIPVYHYDKSLLFRVLHSIFTQDYAGKIEVIIINNHPNNELSELIQGLNIIYLEESQKGAAFARNTGIKASKGEFLAFIDCDVVIESQWTKKLMATLKNHEAIGTQGNIIPNLDRNHWLSVFRYKYKAAQVGPHYNELYFSQNTQVATLTIINSAACLYQAQALRASGGFDENMKWCEDTDLAMKMEKLFGKERLTPCLEANCIVYFGQKLTYLPFLKKLFFKGIYYSYLLEKWNVPPIEAIKYRFYIPFISFRQNLFYIICCVVLTVGNLLGLIGVISRGRSHQKKKLPQPCQRK